MYHIGFKNEAARRKCCGYLVWPLTWHRAHRFHELILIWTTVKNIINLKCPVMESSSQFLLKFAFNLSKYLAFSPDTYIYLKNCISSCILMHIFRITITFSLMRMAFNTVIKHNKDRIIKRQLFSSLEKVSKIYSPD